MKNKLKIVNHLKNSENSLLRAVAEKMMNVGSGRWIEQVEEYSIQFNVTIGTSYAELTKMKKKLISR